MSESEYSQLKLTATYLKNSNLLPHLRNHDWNRFALAYNGAGYAQNHYAEKLKEAYRKATETFKWKNIFLFYFKQKKNIILFKKRINQC